MLAVMIIEKFERHGNQKMFKMLVLIATIQFRLIINSKIMLVGEGGGGVRGGGILVVEYCVDN